MSPISSIRQLRPEYTYWTRSSSRQPLPNVESPILAIIDASSIINKVSVARFTFSVNGDAMSVIVFWRYIFRWMVNAACPAFSANTFAALPVGAISTIFCFISLRAFTMAPARVVFPVPAEPQRIIATRSFLSCINSRNRRMAMSCSVVGA